MDIIVKSEKQTKKKHPRRHLFGGGPLTTIVGIIVAGIGGLAIWVAWGAFFNVGGSAVNMKHRPTQALLPAAVDTMRAAGAGVREFRAEVNKSLPGTSNSPDNNNIAYELSETPGR